MGYDNLIKFCVTAFVKALITTKIRTDCIQLESAETGTAYLGNFG